MARAELPPDSPWLADAAEALGLVRSEDGAPLALTWTRVLVEIRYLCDDRDKWRDGNDKWRLLYVRWQTWARELLRERGLQPPHGELGDEAARDAIAAALK